MNFYYNNKNNEKMWDKAYGFRQVYKEYYEGNLSDENITSKVTQPFWQSMYLSRKRLRDNGIHIDMDIENENKGNIEQVDFSDDGKSQVGTFKEPIKIRKRYVKNGHKIYEKTGKKIGLTSVITSHREGEEVNCPNCGHLASIDSYIDGCDYCGSKFQVEDFNEKVSSYSIEEDTDKKSKGLLKKIFFVLGGTMAIAAAAAILPIVILVVGLITGLGDGTGSFGMGIVLMSGYYLVPAFILIIIIYGILVVILYNAYIKNSYRRIEQSQALKTINFRCPNFSAEKFASNLEYKLRNIHFAQNANEVNAFASFELSQVISHYNNVIECNIEKLKFLEVTAKGDLILFKVKVKMKLTKLWGDKIKEETEQVILNISLKNIVNNYDESNIIMYKCENCGSTVSLLNGGVCEYCGTKMDYSKYSFIIDSYYSNCDEKEIINERVKFGNKKYKNPAKQVKLRVAMFIIAALLLAGGVLYINCRNYFYVVFHYDELMQVAMDYYEKVPRIEDVSDNVKLVNKNNDEFVEKYTYSYDNNIEEAVNNYKEELKKQGYTLYINEKSNVVMAKLTDIGHYADMEVYHIIRIKGGNGELTITFEIGEFDEIYD